MKCDRVRKRREVRNVSKDEHQTESKLYAKLFVTSYVESFGKLYVKV